MLDFLLDSAASDHFVHKHWFFLADPVGAVSGLILCCRVPPRVIVNNRVSLGQVQANPACFEADQKDLQLAALEVLDWRASVPGLACEQGVADVALLQFCFDQAQHRGELRKQQDAPPFSEQAFEHDHQAVQLARGAAFFRGRVADQSQVAAHLAQFEQGFKNDDLASADTFAGDFIAYFFVHRQAHGFVYIALRLVEIDPVDDLGFGRQFGCDLLFGATQQKRFNSRIQMLQPLIVALAFDRHAVIAVKGFDVTQPARQ